LSFDNEANGDVADVFEKDEGDLLPDNDANGDSVDVFANPLVAGI